MTGVMPSAVAMRAIQIFTVLKARTGAGRYCDAWSAEAMPLRPHHNDGSKNEGLRYIEINDQDTAKVYHLTRQLEIDHYRPSKLQQHNRCGFGFHVHSAHDIMEAMRRSIPIPNETLP